MIETLDLICGLRSVQTTSEFSRELEACTRCLGFDYFAFGIRMPFPLTAVEFLFVSNYPSGWQQLYDERGYICVDPVIQRAFSTREPFAWNEDERRSSPGFWSAAFDFGLRNGMAQATRGLVGPGGLLSLARERGCGEDLQVKSSVVSLLSLVAHEAAQRLLLKPLLDADSRGPAPAPGGQDCRPRLPPDSKLLRDVPDGAVPRLTLRETEVLRWTAEGKAACDIAQILEITERTVNFHIGNCMRKLGATSKTSAAVQAALWGVL